MKCRVPRIPLPASELVDATKPFEEIFADQLRFEHDLVAQRMGWLMTINGFLIGGTAVLLANQDKFILNNVAVFIIAFIVMGLLGVLCNISSLYSNRWAARAIHEAGRTLVPAWEAAGLSRARIADKINSMRLYGRDPRSLTAERAPRSEVLHPWILIPAVFAVVYSAAPFLTIGLDPEGQRYWLFLRFVPLIFASIVIGAGWFMDRKV